MALVNAIDTIVILPQQYECAGLINRLAPVNLLNAIVVAIVDQETS